MKTANATKKNKGIIEHFLIAMYSRNRGFFDLRISGLDANNKTEARKEALRQESGQILNIITIYQKEY